MPFSIKGLFVTQSMKEVKHNNTQHMTFSIKGLFVTLRKKEAQHVRHSAYKTVIIMSVFVLSIALYLLTCCF
jgi:hypothetical protein